MNKCLKCGKETYNPKFCSRGCSASYINVALPKRKRTNKCKTCGSLIRASRVYCSKACYPHKRGVIDGYKHIKKYRKKIKLLAVDLLGGKCFICGYNKCITALEFHHLDPFEKDFTFSQYKGSWENNKKELEKCVLLCANCHREVHAGITKLELLPTQDLNLDHQT